MKEKHPTGFFHIQIWIAAIFCSIYVCFRLFYSIMPITYWVHLYDVYPLNDVVKVNTPIIFVSHMNQHRTTNYKYIDTMFCKMEGEKDYMRYSQQITENFAEPPAPETHYPWPFTLGVASPAECYLNSSMRITMPLGNTKAIKLNGLYNDHVFRVEE